MTTESSAIPATLVETIIIRYDNKKVEDECIQSVIEHTDHPYHLTVYDNYPHNDNLGKLWNRLIERSDAPYICLLNSDTKVTDGWLTKLVEVFEKEKDAGIVGPVTNSSRNTQSTEPPLNFYNVVDFSSYSIARSGKRECLSGFCLVFPRRVWEQVDGFAEHYGFYGQENEFIDRIIKEKLKQLWRRDVFVWHEGQSTVKREVEKGKFDELKERRTARALRSEKV